MTRPWRSLWFQCAAVGAVSAAAALMTERPAQAVPGGETRPGLALRGNLAGATGTQRLRFEFFSGGAARCQATVDVTLDASGDFEADLPTTLCPASLFDGGDVTYDVSVGGEVVITRAAVNPVPYAHYAERVGVPECPVGYARDRGVTAFVRCTRPLTGAALDEVVRVGTGTSAFWIDRFEASLWERRDGSGRQFGLVGPASANMYMTPTDHVNGFPDDASGSEVEYAVSVAGVQPSRHTTQIQAMVACQASGKRLPTVSELYLAARGTLDPGMNNGADARCVTSAGALRNTGLGTLCRSAYGAEDLIGNAAEWADRWAIGFLTRNDSLWPETSVANQSATLNINSYANRYQLFLWRGVPAGLSFGGSIDFGPDGGRYALSAFFAAIGRFPSQGFRCVVSR
jgi:hypothetical protein